MDQNTIRFDQRVRSSGNGFEDMILLTWTVTGRVEDEEGAGLAGIGLWMWGTSVSSHNTTTGATGGFTLTHSSYSGSSTPDLWVGENNPACYVSLGAASPNLAVVDPDRLRGEALPAGVYQGQVFTDTFHVEPNLNAPTPSGCTDSVGGQVTFAWSTSCGWVWSSYSYTLTDVASGTVTAQGQTAGGTSGAVGLAVERSRGYRFEVTGASAGYDPATRSAEVQIAWPTPENLEPSGGVPPGLTTFSWSPVAPGLTYRYRLLGGLLHAASNQAPVLTQTAEARLDAGIHWQQAGERDERHDYS